METRTWPRNLLATWIRPAQRDSRRPGRSTVKEDPVDPVRRHWVTSTYPSPVHRRYTEGVSTDVGRVLLGESETDFVVGYRSDRRPPSKSEFFNDSTRGPIVSLSSLRLCDV